MASCMTYFLMSMLHDDSPENCAFMSYNNSNSTVWKQQFFGCVVHNKLWKILKKMGIPDHLTCLPRNLYAGQEATVRTGHGKTNWFQTGKGVHQVCILPPCLFNLHAEYIMWNAELDEAQAGIKTAGRNINNLMTQPLWQKAKKN